MRKVTHKSRGLLVALAAVVVVALLGGAGVLLVRNRVRSDATPQADQIVVASVGDLTTSVSASGKVLPRRQARLSFDAPGRVQQVLVHAGEQVEMGQALVELDQDDLRASVRLAEQDLVMQQANLAALQKGADESDVAAAHSAVASAQAQLDDLLAGPSAEDVDQAEAALSSAQAQLQDLLAGPKQEELTLAQASLKSAKANLEVAKARYAALGDQITIQRRELDVAKVLLDNATYFYNALAHDWQHKDYAPFSPEAEKLKDAQTNYDVALARYNLNKAKLNDTELQNAQAQVAQAEANLTALTKEKTVSFASARAQVAQAEAALAALREDKAAQIAAARERLAQAESSLAALLEGASDEKVAGARAQVEQARIALEDAQRRLTQATLAAPFDGLITAVDVHVGEWISGVAVELIDAGSLEVVLDLDEVDLGAVSVGQSASVTLDPWPSRELSATVTSIAPKADRGVDIVSYEVHLGIEAVDLPMRAGMTANAKVVARSLQGVLLVPNRAITADRQTGKYFVSRLQGQQTAQVEVKIGLRDESSTQVIEGLQEGDKLVLGTDRALNLMAGRPQGMRSAVH